MSSERLATAIGESAVYSAPDKITELLDNKTYGDIVVMGAGENAGILSKIIRKSG